MDGPPKTFHLPSMSSSQLFAPFPGTLDPDQLCGDVAPNVVTTEWYHPNSVRCLIEIPTTMKSTCPIGFFPVALTNDYDGGP